MISKIVATSANKLNPEPIRKILIIDGYQPTTKIMKTIFNDILPEVIIITANSKEVAYQYFEDNLDIGLVIIDNSFRIYNTKGTDIVKWMLSQRKDIKIIANSSTKKDNELLMANGCIFHTNNDKNPETLLKLAGKNKLVFEGTN